MNSATDLLNECRSLDVRLAFDSAGRLGIDAPKDVLTPDLLDRLREQKDAILELLRSEPVDADDPLPDRDDIECIDPNELRPCPTCGTLDQWLSAAGDRFGRTTGMWRCSNCDPPTAARRMAATAARIRGRTRIPTVHCIDPRGGGPEI